MKPAPLFVDANDLCQWLLDHLNHADDILARRICSTCLDLLEAVTLALKDRDRGLNIDRADQELICLRVHIRLAETLGRLTERQAVHAFERMDTIGRQLGGWMRSLGAT